MAHGLQKYTAFANEKLNDELAKATLARLLRSNGASCYELNRFHFLYMKHAPKYDNKAVNTNETVTSNIKYLKCSELISLPLTGFVSANFSSDCFSSLYLGLANTFSNSFEERCLRYPCATA